jgi:hypothetical protein
MKFTSVILIGKVTQDVHEVIFSLKTLSDKT